MRCVALIFLRDLRFTEGCVTTHQENWAQKAAPRSGMLASILLVALGMCAPKPMSSSLPPCGGDATRGARRPATSPPRPFLCVSQGILRAQHACFTALVASSKI